MEIQETVNKLHNLSNLIDLGEFSEAIKGADALLEEISDFHEKDPIYFTLISNLAGVFIDAGHMMQCDQSTRKGLHILDEYKDGIITQIGEGAYFYNLSNAKSNLISDKNPFNHTFSTIEQLIEVKSGYWKAVKSFDGDSATKIDPTYIVNLGNSLKQQFRISEALECYDSVNSLNLDIPQSWINRSQTLEILNQVSNTYSIQMLEQIKKGYLNVISSTNMPPEWVKYYEYLVFTHQEKIDKICNDQGIDYDPHDLDKTHEEYNALSEYRKFCIDKHLNLSEHGLYCACAGSARDNLTILTSSGVSGDFVIPMEMVLNRLKSEFSFARHLHYEYLTQEFDYNILHDTCFSELFNDEMLGINVEKLRTAFRACFGILDKIGIAVCELLDLYPKNGKVYFQGFWQLDQDGRREIFDKHKNPGLLALYSIATDLNDRKHGEWSFLKKLRNDLEHEFVVVHKEDHPSDIYNSYDFMGNIVFIKESDLISHLDRMLQLTRSAIFSFVFFVREKAIDNNEDGEYYLTHSILRKDYIPN